MYFLKTGSPAHLRGLRVFEPLMVITGVAACHPAVDFQVVFHSHLARLGSIIDNLVHLRCSELIVGHIRLLNRTPLHAGNIIGLVMNLLMVNGILMNAGWTY
jgi:hypothetical protein